MSGQRWKERVTCAGVTPRVHWGFESPDMGITREVGMTYVEYQEAACDAYEARLAARVQRAEADYNRAVLARSRDADYLYGVWRRARAALEDFQNGYDV
jgi:hypothetical protein